MNRQDRAVYREFVDAYEDQRVPFCQRIIAAQGDLFPNYSGEVEIVYWHALKQLGRPIPGD